MSFPCHTHAFHHAFVGILNIHTHTHLVMTIHEEREREWEFGTHSAMQHPCVSRVTFHLPHHSPQSVQHMFCLIGAQTALNAAKNNCPIPGIFMEGTFLASRRREFRQS